MIPRVTGIVVYLVAATLILGYLGVEPTTVWGEFGKEVPLVGVLLASWGIAFVEYCFAIPAHRYRSALYSTAELKTIQEVITLVIFAGFSFLYLKEPLGWNHAAGFALIAAGAFLVFQKW